MNQILKSIQDERAALKQRIKNDQDRLAKLDQLASLANDLYPDNLSADEPRVITGSGHLAAGKSSISGVAAVSTKRDRILIAAEEILSDGIGRDSRSLLPELEARGVTVGGSNPVNNLSAYLSAAKDRFESDRAKGGWLLRTQRKQRVATTNDDLLN